MHMYWVSQFFPEPIQWINIQNILLTVWARTDLNLTVYNISNKHMHNTLAIIMLWLFIFKHLKVTVRLFM